VEPSVDEDEEWMQAYREILDDPYQLRNVEGFNAEYYEGYFNSLYDDNKQIIFEP
jgi:hypothetical protein